MKQKRNIPNLDFSELFIKRLAEASDEIKAAIEGSIELFLEDPNHPALRNHALKEKFAGFRSIDVTGDYRAVFKEITAVLDRRSTYFICLAPMKSCTDK